MILATTASSIKGYQIVAYKGTAQSATFEGPLSKIEVLGANAVLNVCYDNTLSADTLFHGSAVVVEPVPIPAYRRPEELHPSSIPATRTETNGEIK